MSTLGQDVMNDIAEAFGLSENVQRVIIDLQVNCIARVIIVDSLTKEQQDVLMASLKRVTPEVIGDVRG